MPLYVTVATEDVLSEAVALRLLAEQAPRLLVHQPPLGRQGFGYLKRKLENFRLMARRQPVLMLTDLDNAPCAPALLADWSGGRANPPYMLLRVVVREIEAWLLADPENLAQFLSIKSGRFPAAPETSPDPKADLVHLCQKARPSDLRHDLVPVRGSTAKVGLGYNLHMARFVRDHWNPARAAESAPSLARTRHRLAELAATAP